VHKLRNLSALLWLWLLLLLFPGRLLANSQPFAYNNNAFVYSGGWVPVSHTDTASTTRTGLNQDRYYAEVAFGFTGTEVDCYAAYGTAETVKYRVDGGNWTALANNGNVWGTIVIASGLSDAPHYIQIKCAAANQNSNSGTPAATGFCLDTQANDAFTVTGSSPAVNLPATSAPWGFNVYSAGGTSGSTIFYLADTSEGSTFVTGSPGGANVTVEDAAAAFSTGQFTNSSDTTHNNILRLATNGPQYFGCEASVRFFAQCQQIWVYCSAQSSWSLRCGDVQVGQATAVNQVATSTNAEAVWTQLGTGLSNVYPVEYTISSLGSTSSNANLIAVALVSPGGNSVFTGNPTVTNAALTANTSTSLSFGSQPAGFVANVPLTISDGANSEVVTVAASYTSGTTIPILGGGTGGTVKFSHNSGVTVFYGPPPPRSLLATLGDSFTLATTISNPDSGYSRVLSSQLGLGLIQRGVGGTTIVNFGSYSGFVGPNTMSTYCIGNRYTDVTGISPKPSVIVVMGGTNDLYQSTENSAATGIYLGSTIGASLSGGHTANFTVTQFQSAYATLISNLVAGCPNAVILCCSIPPKSVLSGGSPYVSDNLTFNASGQTNAQWKAQMNAAILADVVAANNANVRYVDIVNTPIGVFSAMVPGDTIEGWHPSPGGYKKFAAALFAILKQNPPRRRLH